MEGGGWLEARGRCLTAVAQLRRAVGISLPHSSVARAPGRGASGRAARSVVVLGLAQQDAHAPVALGAPAEAALAMALALHVRLARAAGRAVQGGAGSSAAWRCWRQEEAGRQAGTRARPCSSAPAAAHLDAAVLLVGPLVALLADAVLGLPGPHHVGQGAVLLHGAVARAVVGADVVLGLAALRAGGWEGRGSARSAAGKGAEARAPRRAVGSSRRGEVARALLGCCRASQPGRAQAPRLLRGPAHVVLLAPVLVPIALRVGGEGGAAVKSVGARQQGPTHAPLVPSTPARRRRTPPRARPSTPPPPIPALRGPALAQ